MAEIISPNLLNLLKKTVNGDIEEYTIELSKNIAGVGFSGEVIFVTLIEKKSGKKQNLVIKQQLGIDGKPIENLSGFYSNEISFYEVIWPKLRSFYASATGTYLNFVPECLGTIKEGMLALVFENLHASGFQTSDKSMVLSENHFELLFKVYGVFHGVSMAFKEKHPEEYLCFIEKIQFGWKEIFSQMVLVDQFLNYVIKKSQTFFNQETEKYVIEKLQIYDGIGPEFMVELVHDETSQRVIKHGDCWSCNMMFKYNENERVEDMRLLDFQVVGSGTPVHDLSYCFYSGADCVSDLPKYLKIYHATLSKTLKKFDLDVEKTYPFDTLMEEWKKHSKFGFFLALMIWNMKYAAPNSSPQLVIGSEYVPWKIADDKVDEYRDRIRRIVLHMYENNFL